MPEEDPSPCRDFERGVCSRGDQCKYYHPETPAEGGKVTVCKDYQNTFCNRMECKFLHLTVEEETEYNNTGTLPEHGGHPEKSAITARDVCKDFLNSKCDRGVRCKFMHIPEGQLPDSAGCVDAKRPRVEVDPADVDIIKENEILRRDIQDVEKQINSLRQTNDTLYELNTRYRSQLGKNKSNINEDSANNQEGYSQYNQSGYSQNSQSTYPPYNQSTYPQYSQSTYPHYSQSTQPQYSQSSYPQYNQSGYQQYNQPPNQQYNQSGYAPNSNFWHNYPQY